MTFLPDPSNFGVRLGDDARQRLSDRLWHLLYVPTDIMPLAGEGAMLAISQVSGVAFSTIKIIFDCSMVAVSLVTCLVMLHALGSVGVGTVLKGITKVLGKQRDAWLGISVEQPCEE